MGRTGIGAAIGLAAAGIAACGLTLVGAGEQLPDRKSPEGGATPQIGADAGGDADEAPAPVRDANVPEEAGCATVFDDDLTSISATWDLYGSAFVAADGLALTPHTSSSVAGAIWRRSELSFAGELLIVVDLTFDTAPGDPVGDGMTVAWLQAPPTYTIGSAGLSMGLCAVGLKGTAVELDALNGRLVVLNGFENDCDTDGAILAGVAVERATQVTVDIRADRMTGTLSTGQSMTRTKTIPTTGYLGITAATGGGNTRHVVHHVRVTSCP
jgi:hypothetical protein